MRKKRSLRPASYRTTKAPRARTGCARSLRRTAAHLHLLTRVSRSIGTATEASRRRSDIPCTSVGHSATAGAGQATTPGVIVEPSAANVARGVVRVIGAGVFPFLRVAQIAESSNGPDAQTDAGPGIEAGTISPIGPDATDPGGSREAGTPDARVAPNPTASGLVDSVTDAQTTGTLEIVTVSPLPEATDIASDATITITFSSDLDASAATAFKLTTDGTPVPGTAQVVGHTLTFTPEHPFPLARSYRAELGADWSREHGLASSELVPWGFTTVDGEWGAVLAIDEGSGGSKEPSVGITADGTAVVVWSYSTGGHFSIFASQHPRGGDWSSPYLLEEGIDGDCIGSDVATSATGGAYAVWQCQEGDRTYIRLARFVANTWGSASTVSDNADCTKSPNYSTTCNASGPQVSVNDTGAALVGWGEVGASYMTSTVMSRRIIPGSTPDVPLSVPGQRDLQLAISQTGTGLALFTAHGYIGTAYLGAQPNTQWVANTGGELGLLEAQVGAITGSSVAFDWQGQGHVVWPSSGGIEHWILTPDLGWGSLSVIGDGEAPVLVAARNNSVLATWVSRDPTQGALSAASFNGDLWNDPQVIAPVLLGAGEDIQMAADEVGNSLVVWTQRSDANTEVWWNRYALGAWRVASKLNTSGQNMERVRVGENDRGAGVAVWQQTVGSSSRVYARVFE